MYGPYVKENATGFAVDIASVMTLQYQNDLGTGIMTSHLMKRFRSAVTSIWLNSRTILTFRHQFEI